MKLQLLLLLGLMFLTACNNSLTPSESTDEVQLEASMNKLGASTLEFAPAGPVVYPDVALGDNYLRDFYVSNISGKAIPSCNSATLTGKNPGQFSISGAASCVGGIPVGGTCSGISVSAKPKTVGVKSATLKIVCGRASRTVELSYTAIASSGGSSTSSGGSSGGTTTGGSSSGGTVSGGSSSGGTTTGGTATGSSGGYSGGSASGGSTGSYSSSYYIAPTGSDSTGDGSQAKPWKTLCKATSSASAANSIIRLAAGTYAETQNCDLAPGVSIEGAGIDKSIVKSNLSGQWSAFLTLDSPRGTNGNQSISHVTFDGQYVSESNFKTWMGIWITGRSNVVIHDTKIINFKDRGVIYNGNASDSPMSDPGNHATGNKFYNNIVLNSATNVGSYGAGLLNVGGTIGMEIFNNTLIQNQRVNFKNGWPIKYWSNGYNRGMKIYRNIIVKAPYVGTYPGENGDWDFAIELFNNSGLEIYENNIQGSVDINYNRKGNYAFSAWIHHNTINHETFNPRYESGIIFEFATESAIVENNVINNACSGVQFNTRGPTNTGDYDEEVPAPVGGYSRLTNNIIRNNLFSNVYQQVGGMGGGAGIMVISEGTDDPYIRNMQIYNNTIIAKPGFEPWVGLDFTSQPKGSAQQLMIRNNIVMGFQMAWLAGSNGATNISNSVVTNNIAWGNANNNQPLWPAGAPTSSTLTPNTVVDPKLAADYTLQVGSPAIDKGVNVGLPYLGTAPDIGAYEKQ